MCKFLHVSMQRHEGMNGSTDLLYFTVHLVFIGAQERHGTEPDLPFHVHTYIYVYIYRYIYEYVT